MSKCGSGFPGPTPHQEACRGLPVLGPCWPQVWPWGSALGRESQLGRLVGLAGSAAPTPLGLQLGPSLGFLSSPGPGMHEKGEEPPALSQPMDRAGNPPLLTLAG